MGGSSSKKSRKVVPDAKAKPIKVDREEPTTSLSSLNCNTNWDKQIVNVIKKDLNETPELFVLNNMLMAVMFFENYSKDIEELAQRRCQKEKEVLVPDIILETVNKNVSFQPFHGPNKFVSGPLVPRRLFVLNQSVRVLGITEDAEDIDTYAVRAEESRRKGFVRLREIETSYMPNDSPPISEQSESTSRTSSDSETFDYAKFVDIKTPKSIDIYRTLSKQENIPKTCIAYRKVKKPINFDDDIPINEITDDYLYETISYVGSKCFMKHFQNNIFPNTVAMRLGVNEDEVYQSRAIPGKVFCKITNEDATIPCEVVPSFRMNWPGEQTLEFMMKSQRTAEGRKRFIFPTHLMISEIKKLGCVVVPKGYIKKLKKGDVQDTALEWEICFPQAERYLETYMSHAQMKCLLFLLALHKTYIEPKTMELGLLREHLRTFMLWECESNYSDWPEHRLGTKMINVIKHLHNNVAKSHIPDFFIKEKNHLDNIPKKYLRYSQKVLHDILEAPLMSFIQSLRNLRYTRGRYFYHPFNFKKLHEILKTNGIQLTNPQLTSQVIIPPNLKPPEDVDNETRWSLWEQRRRKELILRKKREEQEKLKELAVKQDNGRKGSVDSIDLNWQCEKHFGTHKKRRLLKFFIETFIEIAQKSQQISSEKQALFYLKQSRYLIKILDDECAAFGKEVDELLNVICEEELKCKQMDNRLSKSVTNLTENKSVNKAWKSTTNLLSENETESIENKHLLNREISVNSNGCSPTKKAAPRKTVAFIESPIRS